MLIVGGIAGIVTTWNAFLVGSSRLLFALAESNMLPRVFARLHPRYGTPHIALMAVGLLTCISPWFGRPVLIWLLNVGSFGVIVAYIFVALSFLALRRREPQLARPYRVPGGGRCWHRRAVVVARDCGAVPTGRTGWAELARGVDYLVRVVCGRRNLVVHRAARTCKRVTKLKIMDNISIPAPYESTAVVKPEWLDDNGHMNVAYYLSAFDDGGEVFFDDPGIGWEYTRRGDGSVFIVSSKLDFKQELVADDPIRVTTRLIDFNDKLIHTYQEIFHGADGFLAAAAELVFVHVRFSDRKSSPLPDTARERLAQILAVHRQLPEPPGLGRGVGLKKR